MSLEPQQETRRTGHYRWIQAQCSLASSSGALPQGHPTRGLTGCYAVPTSPQFCQHLLSASFASGQGSHMPLVSLQARD